MQEPIFIATGRVEKLGNSFMFCYLKKSDIERLKLEGKILKAVFYEI